jgi:hypothetical protein
VIQNNVIANNGHSAAPGNSGVIVVGGQGNVIRGNSIYGNAFLGIDLGDDGVTLNNSQGHSGANRFQNFPVLTGVATAGGNATVQGTLSSTPNTTFVLDFFASAAFGLGGFGQGQTYLGSVTVTTDAGGNASFSFTAALVPGQSVITATATDPAGNTSEFSAAVLAYKEVQIDVKPGDSANRVNLNSNGLLPVAVLTTPDFDATTADLTNLSRIRFGDASGTARVSPVRAALEDVDGDGDLDLLLFFSVRQLRESGALTTATTQVELTGFTTGGTPFRGVDAVSVVNGPLDAAV